MATSAVIPEGFEIESTPPAATPRAASPAIAATPPIPEGFEIETPRPVAQPPAIPSRASEQDTPKGYGALKLAPEPVATAQDRFTRTPIAFGQTERAPEDETAYTSYSDDPKKYSSRQYGSGPASLIEANMGDDPVHNAMMLRHEAMHALLSGSTADYWRVMDDPVLKAVSKPIVRIMKANGYKGDADDIAREMPAFLGAFTTSGNNPKTNLPLEWTSGVTPGMRAAYVAAFTKALAKQDPATAAKYQRMLQDTSPGTAAAAVDLAPGPPRQGEPAQPVAAQPARGKPASLDEINARQLQEQIDATNAPAAPGWGDTGLLRIPEKGGSVETVIARGLRNAASGVFPVIPPTAGEPGRIARGVTRGGEGFASGMTTPKSLLLLVGTWGLGSFTSPVFRVLNVLVSKGFSINMLWSAAKQAPQLIDAIRKGDVEGASETLTSMGFSTAMGVSAGAHGVKGARELARSVPSPEGLAGGLSSAWSPENVDRQTTAHAQTIATRLFTSTGQEIPQPGQPAQPPAQPVAATPAWEPYRPPPPEPPPAPKVETKAEPAVETEAPEDPLKRQRGEKYSAWQARIAAAKPAPAAPPIPAGFEIEKPPLVRRTDARDSPGLGPGFGVYRVPVSMIDAQDEITGDAEKKADVERYAAMFREGKEPPALFGSFDEETGRVNVTEGHRRLAAAKLAGESHLPVAIMTDYEAPAKPETKAAAPAIEAPAPEAKAEPAKAAAAPEPKGLPFNAQLAVNDLKELEASARADQDRTIRQKQGIYTDPETALRMGQHAYDIRMKVAEENETFQRAQKALASFRELARSKGLDPEKYLREAGLPAQWLESPEPAAGQPAAVPEQAAPGVLDRLSEAGKESEAWLRENGIIGGESLSSGRFLDPQVLYHLTRAVAGDVARGAITIRAAAQGIVDRLRDKFDDVPALAAIEERIRGHIAAAAVKSSDASAEAEAEGRPGEPGIHAGSEKREIPEPRRPKQRVIYGDETEVFAEGREKPYRARYSVRELEDTYPSHNPFSWEPSPDFHHINDRDYKLPLNQARVVDHSGGKFAPVRIINTNPDAINGPSIIDWLGNVLGGNNRRMALERVYAMFAKGADAYRAMLVKKAAHFGLDPAEVAQFKRPVLVRELYPEEVEPQRAITEFNLDPAGAHSIGERAAKDARMMTAETGKYLADKIEAAGADATLTDVLNTKQGEQIVNHLIRAGVFTENERPALLDAKTNAVTAEGKTRIAKMLLGGLFKDSEAFQAAEASLRNKLERVAPILKQLESNPEWNLTPDVKQAIEALIFERDYGKAYGLKPGESFQIKAPASEHQGEREHQAGMFGDAPQPPVISARAKAIGDFIRTNSPTAIARAFRAYAEKSTEKSLFARANPDEAFAGAFGRDPRSGRISPELLTLGIPAFLREDVAPVLRDVAAGLRDTFDDIMKVLAPTLRSRQSLTASMIMRGKLAELARKSDQAQASLRVAARYFNRRPTAENYDFITRMESGAPQANADLDKIALSLRTLLDGRKTDVQALGTGKLQTYYKDYFPHIWKNPKRAANIFAAFFGKRPLEGGKSFLKKRTLPTFADGIQRGLEPATDNPVDLVLLKIREMDKYIMAHETLNDWKASKLARFVDARKGKAPRGWKKIEDAIGTVYGPSIQQIAEYPNEGVYTGLQKAADALGITHERGFLKGMGQAIGRAYRAGAKVKTLHGTAEGTLAHEIGHQIDWLSGSGKRFVLEYPDPQTVARLKAAYKTIKDKGSSPDARTAAYAELKSLKGAIADRKEFARQLRALADLRDAPQQYRRSREEKMAQLAQMWIEGRPLFERTAPKVFDLWKKFLNENPSLHPLRDVEASANKMFLSQPYDVGGLVVKGHYWAPEGAARILNNYLSPGLRQYGAYRVAIGLNNVLNQFQLGMSAFHLGFTAADTTVSKAALGYQALLTGHPIKAAKFFAQTPTAAFTTFMEGNRMLKEWYKPGSQGGAIGKLVDNLVTAGGRARMDQMYRTQIGENLLAALRHGNVIGAAIRAPFAGVEFVSNLIMNEVVPRMKLGAFADMARFHLEQRGPNATFEDARRVLTQDWNSIENRLGELTYDDLFWNRIAKDLAMLWVRSVGWNLGTLREIGGGIGDVAAQPYNKLQGKPVNLNRLSYLLGLVTVNAVMSAVYQKLKTGKGPGQLEDYFFPKNGETDEHGHAQRVSWPTYVKDVYHYGTHPIHTLESKIAPIWTFFAEMIHNENFYHVEVRHPDDPLVKQLAEEAKHVVGQFIPIAVRNALRERSLGAPTETQAEQFVGITAAPTELNETPAERMAREFEAARVPDEPRTAESAERRDLRESFTRALRQGKPAPKEVIAARLAGKLSKRDIEEARRNAHESPLRRAFTGLGIDDAAKVFTKATAGEKRELYPVFRDKWKRAIKNAAPAARAKIVDEVRAAIAGR